MEWFRACDMRVYATVIAVINKHLDSLISIIALFCAQSSAHLVRLIR